MDEAKAMIRRNDTCALREFMKAHNWKPADTSQREQSKSGLSKRPEVSEVHWLAPFVAHIFVRTSISHCRRQLFSAQATTGDGNGAQVQATVPCLRAFLDEQNHTLLTFAASVNRLDCVRVLFEFDVDCCCDYADNQGKTALVYALENDNLSLALTLINFGCSVNAKCGTWLRTVYLKHGDMRRPFFSALSFAANHCDARRVLLLLENGANANLRGFYSNAALHDVRGNAEIAEMLCCFGAQLEAVNDSGCTPLHVASIRGEENVVAFLIQNGADVNSLDINDATPLHKAVRENKKNVAKLLLIAGASINRTDSKRLTALHYAVKELNVDMVRVIVDVMQDVMQDVSSVQSVLPPYSDEIRYNKEKSLEIAMLLLAAKADVNDQVDMFVEKNTTALHRAVLFEDINYIQLLLSHGADPNLKDVMNFSAIDYAIDRHKLELVNVLSQGANIKIDALFFAMYMQFDDAVKLLIHNGVVVATVSYTSLIDKAHCYPLLLINSIVNVEAEPVSPFSYCIANGKHELAEHFLSMNYLTHYDLHGFLQSLTAQVVIEQQAGTDLKLQKCQDVLKRLIPCQPWSLATLSFQAVTSALGTHPGREERVASLNLPYFIKQRLLYKDEELEKKGKGGAWGWEKGVFKRKETEIDILKSLRNRPNKGERNVPAMETENESTATEPAPKAEEEEEREVTLMNSDDNFGMHVFDDNNPN